MAIGLDFTFKNGKLKIEKTSESVLRPYKGKSLLSLPTDYVVLDIETTGLMPGCDEIIEVSALKCRDNEIIDEFSTLICPRDLDAVDSYITKLTGISQDMLLNQPSIGDILTEFDEFVGNDIIVAHNANFDINFIYDTYEEYSNHYFCNNFVDTLRIARRGLPNLPNHKLSSVANNFGIDLQITHRALADCKITQKCYIKLIDIVNHNPDVLRENLDLRKLSANVSEIDPDNPFYGKECVFTGKLEKMLRADAAQLVVNLGATAGNNVTAKTNFLILGNNDYCSKIKDGKSTKHKKAENLILQGVDLQIMPENVFYELIAEYQNIN